MSVRYACDGCGRDVTRGARMTLSGHGFEWGGPDDEHFCSGACLVGHYNNAVPVENLLREYRRNVERAEAEKS